MDDKESESYVARLARLIEGSKVCVNSSINSTQVPFQQHKTFSSCNLSDEVYVVRCHHKSSFPSIYAVCQSVDALCVEMICDLVDYQ